MKATLSRPIQAETLTNNDLALLVQCETVIEKGLKTFREVGSALGKIRDLRLYRETHSTFEDYCAEKWGFSRDKADRSIKAVEIADKLLTVGVEIGTEYQARQLGQMPEETLQSAIATAKEEAKAETVPALAVIAAAKAAADALPVEVLRVSQEETGGFTVTAPADVLQQLADSNSCLDLQSGKIKKPVVMPHLNGLITFTEGATFICVGSMSSKAEGVIWAEACEVVEERHYKGTQTYTLDERQKMIDKGETDRRNGYLFVRATYQGKKYVLGRRYKFVPEAVTTKGEGTDSEQDRTAGIRQVEGQARATAQLAPAGETQAEADTRHAPTDLRQRESRPVCGDVGGGAETFQPEPVSGEDIRQSLDGMADRESIDSNSDVQTVDAETYEFDRESFGDRHYVGQEEIEALERSLSPAVITDKQIMPPVLIDGYLWVAEAIETNTQGTRFAYCHQIDEEMSYNRSFELVYQGERLYFLTEDRTTFAYNPHARNGTKGSADTGKLEAERQQLQQALTDAQEAIQERDRQIDALQSHNTDMARDLLTERRNAHTTSQLLLALMPSLNEWRNSGVKAWTSAEGTLYDRLVAFTGYQDIPAPPPAPVPPVAPVVKKQLASDLWKVGQRVEMEYPGEEDRIAGTIKRVTADTIYIQCDLDDDDYQEAVYAPNGEPTRVKLHAKDSPLTLADGGHPVCNL